MLLFFPLLVPTTNGTYNRRSFLPLLTLVMPIIYPPPHQTQRGLIHQHLQFPPLKCSKCLCLQTEQQRRSSFVYLPTRSLTSQKTRYLTPPLLHHVLLLLLLQRLIHQSRPSPPVDLNVRQVLPRVSVKNAQSESVFIARISFLLMFPV